MVWVGFMLRARVRVRVMLCVGFRVVRTVGVWVRRMVGVRLRIGLQLGLG